MTKVAIIGAGIVWATAAYYVSQDPDVQVTVYDHGLGQATRAAAGIICPWFSKRRNKAWYRMARLGADFYQTLLADLTTQGHPTNFYQQTGVFLLKKQEDKLADLLELAKTRREESPLIGDLKLLDKVAVQQLFPGLTGFEQLLYASGGARVDGALLTQTLLEASKLKVQQRKVWLERLAQGWLVEGQMYDQVILATGAWLPEILEPLGYQVDVRPQKGQLRDYQLDCQTDSYPVVMPEGELDIIPFAQGKISVGASHENDQGFDLAVDQDLLEQLEEEALTYFPALQESTVLTERVGTRAYTSDFSPFFGTVPGVSGLYAASGLGSSGLTTGPLIGYQLAQMVLGQDLNLNLNPADYPIESYIRKSV